MSINIPSTQNAQPLPSTSDFYAAAFLYSKLPLAGIDRTDPRRCRFIFSAPSEEVAKLIDAFKFARDNDPLVSIDSRKFVTAIKTLKSKLYQD